MNTYIKAQMKRAGVLDATGVGVKDGSIVAADIASNAVETAKIKDANVTAAKLENALADGLPKVVAFTIAGTNPKTATFQFKDAQGNDLAAVVGFRAWLASSATTLDIHGSAPDGTVAFTTGLATKEVTTKLLWQAVTSATGSAVLSVQHTSGAQTYYLAVEVGGRTYVSGAIALGA